MFDKPNWVFSCSLTDLGFSVKIRHKMKLNADAKPFQWVSGSISFGKRKAINNIAKDIEKGNLGEPTHSSCAAPTIGVIKPNIFFYFLYLRKPRLICLQTLGD